MRDSAIFIADGHHRYEAAMRYRSAIRARREIDSDEAVNYRMMHIVSIDEPGLITRGYHRVIHGATPVELDRLVKRLMEVCEVENYALKGTGGETPSEMLKVLGTRDDGSLCLEYMGCRMDLRSLGWHLLSR